MKTHEELVKEGTEKGQVEVKTKQIEGTPFIVIEESGGFYGVMGKYRLTEKKENLEEVKKEITEMSWNNIVKIMMIINDINVSIKEINETETK